MRETVIGLNLLHNGGWREGATSSRAATQAQERVLAHVRGMVDLMGAPDAPSATGALAELCGSPGSYDQSVPSSLAPLDISLLSLPEPGHRPRFFAAVFEGEAGHHIVEEFCSRKVLSSQLAVARLEGEGVGKSYNDPI